MNHLNIMVNSECACGNKKKSSEIACTRCSEDLNYIITERSAGEGFIYMVDKIIPLNEFIQGVKKNGISPTGVCSICGGHFVWGGNSPAPVVSNKEARCCARCNSEIVIPARIKILSSK